MALKVLCAGCPKDERERAEAEVRSALGRRLSAEAWTVSLVKVQGRWSVTLDGPGARGLTFVASEGSLTESIRNALSRGPSGAPGAATGASSQRRERHACQKCQRPFAVLYEAMPDEPQETAPVACPRCWHVNHVLVAENAAQTKDYRAEAVEP